MKLQLLTDLGLSKNEGDVYLKLIELGPSTAVQIAKASRLHRSNVYDVLNKLAKKGLVAYFLRQEVNYYEVVDPEQLTTLLKSKELALQRLIPVLKAMQLAAKPSSSVALFEGVVGVRYILMDIINNTKKIYVLGVPKDYAKICGEGWISQWHKKRIDNKILFYHILNEDYYLYRIRFLRKLKYTKLKFLPKEYSTPNALFIYDKGIMLGFMQPFISIKILGEDVAKSFKNYYKMLEKISLDKTPQEESK
jgi:sugar-specific transcriptional regulator TrmB